MRCCMEGQSTDVAQRLKLCKNRAKVLPNSAKLGYLEKVAQGICALTLKTPAFLCHIDNKIRREISLLTLSPALYLAREDKGWLQWKRRCAVGLRAQLVVSLTSYGRRVVNVHKVIESLLCQTVLPEKIVLYLADTEFAGVEALPVALRNLLGTRFEIRFVDDLKSHKKYFYAFQEFTDAIIVTVDDDVCYPPTLLERLMVGYHRHPYSVVCARSHTLCFGQNGDYASYRAWMGMPKIFNRPSMLVVPTGVGGVLYPPHCFDETLFDWETIQATCLSADDLWLKWHTLVRGIPSMCVSDAWEDNYIEGSQDETLCSKNVGQEVGETLNDVCWRRILAVYAPQSKLRQIALADLFEALCGGGGTHPLVGSALLRYASPNAETWDISCVGLGNWQDFQKDERTLVG